MLIGLGQSPFSLVPISAVGLFLSFVLFETAKTSKQAMLLGWGVGVGYFGLVLSWIVEPFLIDAARYAWMSPFALVGMAGGMALFWGAAFGLARHFGGPFALVVFWTIGELTRTYILTGFPWGLLAYIWLDYGLDQWVAFIGPHGLTFLTLLFIWVLYRAIYHPKRLFWVPLVLALFGGTVVFGFARADFYWASDNPEERLAQRPIVRLIQPNAPQNKKWKPEYLYDYFSQNLEFTAAQSSQKPDLIIWPETAVPFLLNRADDVLKSISNAANDTPVIFGIQRQDEHRYLNSLVLLDKNGKVVDIYDKSHLVPFGEYAPGGKIASTLGFKGLAANDGYAFGQGDGLRVLTLEKFGQFLPLICYEAIFPQDIAAADANPDWLLHITNDAWFGSFSGPYQHLAQARFRAIEQGVPLIRAANTGVSAVIDARGNIVASLDLGVASFLDTALPRPFRNRFYAKAGDIPIFVVLLALFGFVLFQANRNKD